MEGIRTSARVKWMGASVVGVVFDLDNTLLDREALFMRVAEAFYEEHLHAKTSATRAHAVARMVEWDADGYADRRGMLMRWTSEWPETGLDLESLQAWYRLATEQQVRPDREVNALLGHLNDRGVPWGIATNGSSSQRIKCQAAGLSHLAPFILVSEEVGYAKPDPRIFAAALRSTGLSTPEQVLFVGDNPEADIDGAKSFGMRAAWVRRGRQYPPGLRAPEYVIDAVTEIRGIVAVWARGVR